MTSIVTFNKLNADGTPGEEIEIDTADKNKCLAVLLKTDVIEEQRIGLVGYFYSSRNQSKVAILPIQDSPLAKPGALILYDQDHFEAQKASNIHKSFSFTPFIYLDESPFYESFVAHNMFRVDLKNFEMTPKEVLKTVNYFKHPIFHRVQFNPNKTELEEGHIYPYLALESNIAPRSKSYGNMKWKLKLIRQVDENGQIVHERIFVAREHHGEAGADDQDEEEAEPNGDGVQNGNQGDQVEEVAEQVGQLEVADAPEDKNQ